MRALAFITVWLFTSTLFAQPTVNIATEEYPPYTSSKLYQNGLDAHIVSRAFEIEGYNTKYHFFPGARAYKMAKEGKFDATLPWVKREDRKVDFFYSDPVIEVEQEHLFFKKERTVDWNPNQPDYSKLVGKRIGAIISYNYGEHFQQAEEQKIIKSFRSGDLKQQIKMLLKGHLDFIISKRQVAQHILHQHFTKEQQDLVTSIPENNNPKTHDYLLVSKKAERAQTFLQAVNRGLAKMKQSGEYQSILNAFDRGEYIELKH